MELILGRSIKLFPKEKRNYAKPKFLSNISFFREVCGRKVVALTLLYTSFFLAFEMGAIPEEIKQHFVIQNFLVFFGKADSSISATVCDKGMLRPSQVNHFSSSVHVYRRQDLNHPQCKFELFLKLQPQLFLAIFGLIKEKVKVTKRCGLAQYWYVVR